MKRIPLILICSILLIGATSCKKNTDDNGNPIVTDEFTLDYTDQGELPANAQLIFDAAPVGQRIPAYSGSFPSNVEAELTAKGTTKENVVSIKGEKLVVSIGNNPTQNFDFMDSVWVYVSQIDGSDKNLFGYKHNYGLGLRSLDLILPDTDVKNVFKSDSVKLWFEGTKRSGSHTIQANTIIDFDAKIKGVFNVL